MVPCTYAEHHSSKEVAQKSFLTSCRREAKEELGITFKGISITQRVFYKGADGCRWKVSSQNELRVLKCYLHTSQARTSRQSENDKG